MSEQQTEIRRLEALSDRLYSNWDLDTRVPDNHQLLAAAVCGLAPNYFLRSLHDRKSTKELLAGQAPKVRSLYLFVAGSDLKPILKFAICGDALSFLAECGTSAKELDELRKEFDPQKFWTEFWFDEEK